MACPFGLREIGDGVFDIQLDCVAEVKANRVHHEVDEISFVPHVREEGLGRVEIAFGVVVKGRMDRRCCQRTRSTGLRRCV